MPRLTKEKIKNKLNYHYKAFDRKTISPDPLEFPHRFTNNKDIEIAAFIASVFAYGGVAQIIKSLESVFQIMGNDPFDFVTNYNHNKDKTLFANIKHRFYSGEDTAALFAGLNKIYTTYGSLNYLFLLYYFEKADNIKGALSFFSNNLTNIVVKSSKISSSGINFMFPDPLKGSACKRQNLFLRWMIRKDELDFGLWKEIPTDKLVIPVDTHIAQISQKLKLTKLKNVSWKMAEEITNNLKKIDSNDPVKYDFALCHIGMRKLDF
ncbi:MAG: TIGR02757 family protein [Ignavibacteriales bacterium CG18_big_fil_WC_8_21_14_2_50_31_20]|nr:MAG: TIGR02757 family protein [Ignavibacteriales bacterium CG18_big_fil_WC_8_21_14_2_50_31_20]